MEYWEMLGPKLIGEGLTQKEAMRRLNDSRVAMKHHGNLPSKLSIESFRASCYNFFQENTPLVFDVEFESISLIELVENEKAREELLDASGLIQQEILEETSIEEALVKIAKAYRMLIDEYVSEKKASYYKKSPFYFGPSTSLRNAFMMGITKDPLRSYFDNIKDSIEAMRKTIEVLAYGFDYRKYSRFAIITSEIHVNRVLSGNYIVDIGKVEGISSEECQFCIDFVVECAIILQEYDYEC